MGHLSATNGNGSNQEAGTPTSLIRLADPGLGTLPVTLETTFDFADPTEVELIAGSDSDINSSTIASISFTITSPTPSEDPWVVDGSSRNGFFALSGTNDSTLTWTPNSTTDNLTFDMFIQDLPISSLEVTVTSKVNPDPFNAQFSVNVGTVPEPAAVGLAVLGAGVIFLRRRQAAAAE